MTKPTASRPAIRSLSMPSPFPLRGVDLVVSEHEDVPQGRRHPDAVTLARRLPVDLAGHEHALVVVALAAGHVGGGAVRAGTRSNSSCACPPPAKFAGLDLLVVPAVELVAPPGAPDDVAERAAEHQAGAGLAGQYVSRPVHHTPPRAARRTPGREAAERAVDVLGQPAHRSSSQSNVVYCRGVKT